MEEFVDVTIIGGGPTGLFSGLLMQRLGLTVKIFDAKPNSLSLGRADALNARTQQYFEVANLLDSLLPLGITCNTSSTFCHGKFESRQSHWWTGLEHALHKNFLMIGQPQIEKLLKDKLGNAIHYNEPVDSITEDDDSVTVITTQGRKVQSKFAIGADGARSMVRKVLGIDFQGTKPEMLWAVLDTFIETDFPTCPEIITFQLDGQSRVSWIPRERGLCRFYVLLEGEVIQARAEESIKKHFHPYRIDFKKTEWYSTFDVKERIASTFISRDGLGRIILAGDAAHVHSVNGGQGLNTGISDAFALSWRLAHVINGASSSEQLHTVLHSYDLERRYTAANVINVAARLVRDTIHTAKQYVSTIEKQAAYITGMGITYEGLASPLVIESEFGIWKAGYRCPDILLTNHDGNEQWLYQMVEYGKFLILAIGYVHETSKSKENAVGYSLLPPPDHNDDASTKEQSSEVFTTNSVTSGQKFSVVIRPDMYVGFVADDNSAWEHYSKRLGYT